MRKRYANRGGNATEYCGVILQRMADAFPGIEIRKSDA
jgi:hypothetical protein